MFCFCFSVLKHDEKSSHLEADAMTTKLLSNWFDDGQSSCKYNFVYFLCWGGFWSGAEKCYQMNATDRIRQYNDNDNSGLTY